jgi:hypothetical protein
MILSHDGGRGGEKEKEGGREEGKKERSEHQHGKMSTAQIGRLGYLGRKVNWTDSQFLTAGAKKKRKKKSQKIMKHFQIAEKRAYPLSFLYPAKVLFKK